MALSEQQEKQYQQLKKFIAAGIDEPGDKEMFERLEARRGEG